MSLTSPRLIASFMVLSLAALTIVSCSQQNSPTAPSSFTVSTAVQPAVTEYWVTLFDEDPEPAPPAPPPPPGSGPVPWPPGSPPMAAPGIPVPTPPSTHPRVKVRIDPESAAVPHSGTPVPTFSCRNLPHTWYYDQLIHAETGVPVTFSERENFFDGRFVNKNTTTIQLAGNGTVILHTRWCSAFPKPHYTQTRFKGKDEYGEQVVISGPWVQLLTPR